MRKKADTTTREAQNAYGGNEQNEQKTDMKHAMKGIFPQVFFFF